MKKIRWNHRLWMRFPIDRPPAYQVVQRSLLLGKLGMEYFSNHSLVASPHLDRQGTVNIDIEEYLKNTEILDGEALLNTVEALEAEEFMDSAEDFLNEIEKIEKTGGQAWGAKDSQSTEKHETYQSQAVKDGDKLIEENIDSSDIAEDFSEGIVDTAVKAQPVLDEKSVILEDPDSPDIAEDFSEGIVDTTVKAQPVLDKKSVIEEDPDSPDIAEDFSEGIIDTTVKAQPVLDKKSVIEEDPDSPDIAEDFSSEPLYRGPKTKEVPQTVRVQEDSIEKPGQKPQKEAAQDTHVALRSETQETQINVEIESSPPVAMVNKSSQRIFNQDLKQVTNQVLEHSPKPASDSLASSDEFSKREEPFKPASDLEKQDPPSATPSAAPNTESSIHQSRKISQALQELSGMRPYRKSQLYFLKQLYNTSFLKEEYFLPLQKQALKYFNAQSAIFLLWDRFQLNYRPILHSGLHDKSLLHNLCFVDSDPFLMQDSLSQSWESEGMLKDPRALRRFGKSFLKEYESVHILKIQSQEQTRSAFLMLLYKDMSLVRDPKLQSKIKEPPEEYMTFLEECIIPLKSLREELWYNKVKPGQLGIVTKEALSIMQTLAGKSTKNFYALHFRLEGGNYEQNWQVKIYPISEFFSKSLVSQERLLVYNVNRILLLLQETDPNGIIKLAQEFCDREDIQLYVSLSQYPKDGYNFYKYLDASV